MVKTDRNKHVKIIELASTAFYEPCSRRVQVKNLGDNVTTTIRLVLRIFMVEER